MLLRNNTAVVSLRLGLWPSEVWHERDSGKTGAGREIWAMHFLKRESSKLDGGGGGVRPHFAYQTAVPS